MFAPESRTLGFPKLPWRFSGLQITRGKVSGRMRYCTYCKQPTKDKICPRCGNHTAASLDPDEGKVSKFWNLLNTGLQKWMGHEDEDEKTEARPPFEIIGGTTLKVHAMTNSEFQQDFFKHFDQLLTNTPEEIMVDLVEMNEMPTDSLALLKSACIAALEQGIGINFIIHPDTEKYFEATDWSRKIPREIAKANLLGKRETIHTATVQASAKKEFQQPSFLVRGNCLLVNNMSPENFQNRFSVYFRNILESPEKNIVVDISELEILPIDSLRILRNACAVALEEKKGVNVLIHPMVEKTFQTQEWTRKIPREIHSKFFEAARNGTLADNIRVELEHVAPAFQLVGNCLEIRHISGPEFQEKLGQYLPKLLGSNHREVKVDVSRLFDVSDNYIRLLREASISSLAKGIWLRIIIHPKLEEFFKMSRWRSSLALEHCDAPTAEFITNLKQQDEEAKNKREQFKLTAALRLTGLFSLDLNAPPFQLKKNCLEVRNVDADKLMEEFPQYLSKLTKEGYNKIIIDVSRLKHLSPDVIQMFYDAYNELEELGTWLFLRIAPSMEDEFHISPQAQMIPREKHIPLS